MKSLTLAGPRSSRGALPTRRGLHALTQAVLAFLVAIAAALPAQALPPSLQAVVMNTGQIRRVDPNWPMNQPDSGCWTVQVENPHVLAPATKPEKVRLLRAGFDLAGNPTTYVEDLTRTQRVRGFWPHQGTLTDRDALSGYVYRSDKVVGALNGCTTASPPAIANWAMLSRDVVSNSLDWEIVAFHSEGRRGLQVPNVRVRATDSDGGGDCATQSDNSTSVSGRTSDQRTVLVYSGTLDLSACADGLIILNGQIRPWVGDASSIVDSANGSTARGFSPRYFAKYTTGYSRPYAYVATTGNDANDCADTDPTVADNNPCASVNGAINRLHTDFGGGSFGIDGAEIRVEDGAYDIDSTSGAKTQKIGCVTVTRSPTSTSRATVLLTSGDDVANMNLGTGGSLTSPLTTGCLRFRDISLQRTSPGQAFVTGGGGTLDVQWDQVNFDRNGLSSGLLSNTNLYVNGMTCSTTGSPGFVSVASGQIAMLRGVNCDTNGATVDNFLVLGSRFLRTNFATGTIYSGSGTIFSGNENLLAVGGILIGTQFGAVSNVAVVQNVMEWGSASAGHVLAISNDGSLYGNFNTVVEYNTFAGFYAAGRINIYYDEGATPRASRMPRFRNNFTTQLNSKGDVFRSTEGGGSADASYRTGNFAFEHGVGSTDNVLNFLDANNGATNRSFSQEYTGLGTLVGTSATVPLVPYSAFSNWQAATNSGSTAIAGLGSGDYRLKAGNGAIGIVDEASLSHTLDGVARNLTGDDAGALSKE